MSTITTTTTTTFLCICGRSIEINCTKCDILEKEIVQLKADNVQLKADNVQLKIRLDKSEARLDEIDSLSKLRQIAIDLMDKYIDLFSDKFHIELDPSQIYNERKNITKDELLLFDKSFFDNTCTFYEFSKALRNMKKFNKIAHPDYNTNEISGLLESYVNNEKHKELLNYVVSKFVN